MTMKGKKHAENPATLAKLVFYCYVLLMSLLFALQADSSFREFFAKRIVEQVEEEPRNMATLPSVTVCPFTGFKAGLTLDFANNISNYCPDDPEITPQCIDNLLYNTSEIVHPKGIKYPAATVFDAMPFAKKASLNLMLGSCVTYEKDDTPEKLSASIMDIIILPEKEYPDNYAIAVHDRGRFVPLLGIGAEYTGQLWLSLPTTPYTFTNLEMQVTNIHHLNRENYPCNDGHEEYNIVECLEDYVESTLGCKSKWDLFPAKSVANKTCETHEELDMLRELHVKLYSENAADFRDRTGCLRPCAHQTFSYNLRQVYSPSFLRSFQAGENITAIGICLYSTNKKSVTEKYLYGIANLVGEVGGSMGLFLGASLVSLFELGTRLSRKAWKQMT